MKEQVARERNVVVVGCGVIGLTSAIRLQEEGYSVRIIARDTPPWTTSNKAAAIWTPYRAKPEVKVAEWAYLTYLKYAAEYENPRAGVSQVELINVGRRAMEKPFWVRSEHQFREMTDEELPKSYSHGHGFRVLVPFINSTLYLDYLLYRFASNGGDVEVRTLRSLADLGSNIYAVIDCSGLGARELVPDPKVFGIRGQLAVVSLDEPARFIVDETSYTDPVYVFPRGNECILGGTAEEGRECPDEDLRTRREILSRCRELEPAVTGGKFLRPVVGVRPGRHEIRLEVERDSKEPLIIHNYGHGGAGFTVAWGCANEVARLLTNQSSAEHSQCSGPTPPLCGSVGR